MEIGLEAPVIPTPSILVGTDRDIELTEERSVHNWIVFGFDELLKRSKTNADKSDKSKRPMRKIFRRLTTFQRQDKEVSEMELTFEPFICGQEVKRTSSWQMELKCKGGFLCASLICLNCFHEEIDEIWVRFDVDIMDISGKVLYTAGSASFFSSHNLTKFTPRPTQIRERFDGRGGRLSPNSYWEADIIPINELFTKWDVLVPRNMLKLQLKMYIYRDMPFNEAKHIAELQEPVRICYTDVSRFVSSPFLQSIKALWDTMENFDVQFKVDNEMFKAHKLIVSVQSAVLKKLSDENPVEDGITTVDVADCSSPEAFKLLLKYLYTQDAEEVKASSDINMISSVLKVANQFEVKGLARICLVRLLTNMTTENFMDTAVVIYQLIPEETSYFKTEVKKFLMENLRTLQATDSFKKGALDHREIFLKLCFEPISLIPTGSNEGDNESESM